MRWAVVSLIVLACVGGGLLWFGRDHSYFHVSAIRIYGAERVAQAELRQLAGVDGGVSVFRIDVDRVRTRILQHPWIRDALVRRLYPNELEVIVYERKAAAVLEQGRSYLIDAEGYVLGEATPRERASLPRLDGTLAQPLTQGQQVVYPGVHAALQMLAQVQTHPFFRDAGITRVEIVGPERLVLQTRMGKLVMGPSMATAEEKFSLLPTIGDVVRKHALRVESIDLSFADRVVVKAIRTTQGSGRLQKRESGGGQAQ